MKPHIASVLLAAAGLSAACHNEPPPPPAPIPAAAPLPAKPPVAPPAAAPSQATEAPSPGTPVIASPMEQSNAASLTLAVQEFFEKNGRVPRDMAEVAAFKGYRQVPTPPRGTRYVINGQTRQVVIVRQ